MVNRADYGVDDKDMNFKNENDIDKFFGKEIKSDYETIINEPINKPLAEFEKEFVKNDKITAEKFNDLNAQLEVFFKMLDENPTYEYMDIVSVFKEVLSRYKDWATYLRQTAFISKDKMIEVHHIVEKFYMPVAAFSNSLEHLDTAKIYNGKIEMVNGKISDYESGEIVKLIREEKQEGTE